MGKKEEVGGICRKKRKTPIELARNPGEIRSIWLRWQGQGVMFIGGHIDLKMV